MLIYILLICSKDLKIVEQAHPKYRPKRFQFGPLVSFLSFAVNSINKSSAHFLSRCSLGSNERSLNGERKFKQLNAWLRRRGAPLYRSIFFFSSIFISSTNRRTQSRTTVNLWRLVSDNVNKSRRSRCRQQRFSLRETFLRGNGDVTVTLRFKTQPKKKKKQTSTQVEKTSNASTLFDNIY